MHAGTGGFEEDNPVGRPDNAAHAAIAQRCGDPIELRLAGVDRLTVTRELPADPAVHSDRIANRTATSSSGTARAKSPQVTSN